MNVQIETRLELLKEEVCALVQFPFAAILLILAIAAISVTVANVGCQHALASSALELLALAALGVSHCSLLKGGRDCHRICNAVFRYCLIIGSDAIGNVAVVKLPVGSNAPRCRISI